MAIQGTQVSMYTNTHCFCIFQFFLKKFYMENKINQNWKEDKQKQLNKTMHKTRCKCMRNKEERKRSIHGDDTNVLTKEFKPFVLKRFDK